MIYDQPQGGERHDLLNTLKNTQYSNFKYNPAPKEITFNLF